MTENGKGKRFGTIFGALAVLGLLALKFKVAIFAALKALTFIKFGWFFSSFISMFVSIGLYAMFWGWPYAIAIILLLYIHEMGHWIWMKHLGLEPKAPMFLPGIGAYVAMTKLPADEATHAWVALAGPLVGGVGCAALYWAGMHLDNGWCMAAGSTGFMLNLLQLVPAKPLDGGFVISAVSKWLLVPGTAFLFALSFAFHSILLLIISVISLISLIASRFAHGQAPQMQPATGVQRFAVAFAYISLAGMLAYLYWLSHNTVSALVKH